MHPNLSAPIYGHIMVSTNSTGQGYRFIDGKQSVVATPYTYQICEGNVSGHTPWMKIGYNPDIAQLEEDIWWLGGMYVFPSTSGTRMGVYSNNNNDQVAGIGVRTARIDYLDSNYLERSTVVTLNGTSTVFTVATDIARINYFRALTAGTYNMAQGTIYLQESTGLPYYSAISSDQTRARHSVYTVPAGKTLYITSIFFSAAAESNYGKPTRIKLMTNYNNLNGTYSSNMFWAASEVLLKDNPIFGDFAVPSKILEKTDTKVQATVMVSSSGSQVTATMRGWLELN